MPHCVYTAQGQLVCYNEVSNEGFRQGPKQEIDFNIVTDKWTTGVKDPGHIFNACELSKCTMKPMNTSGLNKTYMVTCPCKRCRNGTVITPERSTLSPVVLRGPNTIRGLWWCPGSASRSRESGLQVRPCSEDVLDAINCPSKTTTTQPTTQTQQTTTTQPPASQ